MEAGYLNQKVWIGAKFTQYASWTGEEKNWDIGGDKGVLPRRAQVIRLFEEEAEARAWAEASPLRRQVFPLAAAPASEWERIYRLAEERERKARRRRLRQQTPRRWRAQRPSTRPSNRLSP